jgi:hypothetical protein
MQGFTASEGAQAAPQVQFNLGGQTSGPAPAPASNAPAQ